MKNKARNDVLLAAGIILAAVICALIIFATARDGAVVRITANGKSYGTYPLDEDGEYVISTEFGENVLRIEDGKANIIRATCPDRLCVKHYAVSRDGETIICLPNKLVVEISAEDG